MPLLITRDKKGYQRQLEKMFIVEAVGERLYNVLATKAKDKNLQSICQRLALGELQAREHIEKELSLIDKNIHLPFKGVILSFANFIFCLSTVSQLLWILKSVLKKRIYTRWFDTYKDNNQQFWKLLLDHENMQYKLLKTVL